MVKYTEYELILEIIGERFGEKYSENISDEVERRRLSETSKIKREE